MSVLIDVLAWSESSAPAWMRDALRRIATQGDVTENDVDALAELCKKGHGLSETKATSVPLDGSHFPTSSDVGAVSLVALTHVADVNALEPGATISFAKQGLTVVYGDNGSGKSGYARVLKRACRARGSSEPVLPNALSERPAGTPTAKLTTVVADLETEHLWREGTACATQLAAISVFDASAAQVYVAEKTEVRFRPFGLDVLDRLAHVCAKVKAKLDQERATLEVKRTWPEMPVGTAAADLLNGLTALTPLDLVNRLASVDEAEQRELEMLSDVLAVARSNDPVKLAAELRSKSARVKRLADHLRRVSTQLGRDAVTALQVARHAAADARRKGTEAAQSYVEASRLPGLDDLTWRKLWDAAKDYSESAAYPSHPFPHIAADAHCVLCQQPLDAEARSRLVQFAEFVAAAAQRRAIEAADACDVEEEKFAELSPTAAQTDAREELTTLEPELAAAVEAFLARAQACRDSIVSGSGTATLDLEPPTIALDHLAADQEARAAVFDQAAQPGSRKEKETRHAELRGRQLLAGLKAEILAEIERKARINAYDACAKDTDTRGLSRLSTELTKKYVTEVITSAFNDELRRLGFTDPELELKPAGATKGVLYHRVELKHATRAQLHKVVSEGESRCIALAAFLAELRSSGDASAIVFDDPVSSLDQRWRTRFAARLVEEAKTRQVIVLTHEIVFLHALMQSADAAGVEFASQSLTRTPRTAGHVDSTVPWTAQSTQRRLGWLRNEWQHAEKVFRTQSRKEYDPIATTLYARLRQSWERAVEELLLNGVIERFRFGVETNRLRHLADISALDIATVTDGMTKCSRWEGGHDHALAASDPVPAPDELAEDIAKLDAWVKSVAARRKK